MANSAFRTTWKYILQLARSIMRSDQFFLSVNYNFRSGNLESFYRNCNLGPQNLPKYVCWACHKLSIKGEGVRDSFSAHGLRATAIKNLFESGFEKESVCRKTGHKQSSSLTRYHSNRGKLGQSMQLGMFGDKHQKADAVKNQHSGELKGSQPTSAVQQVNFIDPVNVKEQDPDFNAEN